MSASSLRFSPEQMLKVLGILYAVAGVVALLAALNYLGTGLLAVCGVLSGDYYGPFFIVIGAALLLIGMLWASVFRFLKRRRGRVFCMVNGVLVLPLFPLGSAIGIYTLIVLTRPEVLSLFLASGESSPERV